MHRVKTIGWLCAGFFLAAMCVSSAVFAADPPGATNNVFQSAIDVGTELYGPTQKILLGLATLGVLGVGAMALFGKFPMGWSMGIIAGLVVLMLAGAFEKWIVDVATQGNAKDIKGISSTMIEASTVLGADVTDVLYAVSGIAVVAMAIISMFGRFNWVWFASLVGGVVVITGAAQVVSLVSESLQ